MDDLVAGGIMVVVILFTAAAVILAGLVQVVLLELDALATGDVVFVLASFGILLTLCAAYLGIGRWLHRTGLI